MSKDNIIFYEVKPLEWHETSPGRWIAPTPIGDYKVSSNGTGMYFATVPVGYVSDETWWTPQAAKRIAEQQYEHWVNSCMECVTLAPKGGGS